MTNEDYILSELHQLPENLKIEVIHFIGFLKEKHQNSKTIPAKSKRKPRVFGLSQGAYVLSPDFDAPLDDFKEYM